MPRLGMDLHSNGQDKAMAVKPKYVGPGAGRNYKILGGDDVYVKATGADMGGCYSVFETTVPAGSGPPPHMHHREEEAFYVLEGQFEFKVGEKVISAATGSFLVAPRDVPHVFRNVGQTPARLLIVVTPSGFEDFVEEFATLPYDEPPDIARMVAIGQKYGIEFQF